MINIKKSNVITAIICAVTLSTVSFYTGVNAASSSVSYKSQGKIVFDNNTDDTSDDVVFDASDFKTISDMVISGKKQVGTELNKYPSVNFNLSSSVPDFAELANAVDILTDDTTDTTSDKILKDYTAYVKGNKIKGSIPSKAAATYTPGRSDQTITAGQYLSGVQTIKGDSNLQAANIISGKTIFGVTGNATVESHRIESNKSVTISNTSGSITPTSGNNAMAAVSYSVQGVDASKIVSGQSILGVSGNHTCSTCTQTHRTPQSSKTVTPTAGGLTVTPDSGYNSMDQVVINGDGDLIAENIKSGVEIFGVTGTLNSSSGEGVSNIWGCTKSLTNHTAYTFECGFKPDAIFCYNVDKNSCKYYDSTGGNKMYEFIANTTEGHSSCYLKQSKTVGDVPTSTGTGLWDLTDTGFKFQWSTNNISSDTAYTYHITAVKYN